MKKVAHEWIVISAFLMIFMPCSSYAEGIPAPTETVPAENDQPVVNPEVAVIEEPASEPNDPYNDFMGGSPLEPSSEAAPPEEKNSPAEKKEYVPLPAEAAQDVKDKIESGSLKQLDGPAPDGYPELMPLASVGDLTAGVTVIPYYIHEDGTIWQQKDLVAPPPPKVVAPPPISDVLKTLNPGDKVTITYIGEDGKTYTKTVTVKINGPAVIIFKGVLPGRTTTRDGSGTVFFIDLAPKNDGITKIEDIKKLD